MADTWRWFSLLKRKYALYVFYVTSGILYACRDKKINQAYIVLIWRFSVLFTVYCMKISFFLSEIRLLINPEVTMGGHNEKRDGFFRITGRRTTWHPVER